MASKPRGASEPAPVLLAADRPLPAVFALYHALWRHFPERLRVGLGPGLPVEGQTPFLWDGAHPALYAGFGPDPAVVFAWTGRSAREADIASFLQRASASGVSEVFLFDPSAASPAPGLLGYTLEQGNARAVPNREGVLESRVLGMSFAAEGERLRAIGQDGQKVPFPDELALEVDRLRAEAGRWKTRAEKKDADAARLRIEVDRQRGRADHWKSELARKEDEVQRLLLTPTPAR